MKANLAAAAAVLNDHESFHNLQLAEDAIACPSGATISCFDKIGVLLWLWCAIGLSGSWDFR